MEVLTETFLIGCANLLQKRLHFAKLCVLPNFYPNLLKFLHGYIRHIRDILQLCDGDGGVGGADYYNISKANVAPWCYNWIGYGMDGWISGRVRYSL